jgi:2-iminoacetate synthase ThiH
MDAGLKRELEAKVYAGDRLTRAEGEALYASDDLAWLGRLAHHRRTELNGDRVTFHAGPQPEAAMIYGDRESPADRVDQVLRLRDRQDRDGAVPALVLVRHQPAGDGTAAAPTETLKTFAVSRLLLDNVRHVTCSWASHSLPVAQLTLNFGADDLAGPAEAAETDDLLTLIWDAGFRPVERTAGHEVVREHEPAPSLAGRRSEPQQVWA